MAKSPHDYSEQEIALGLTYLEIYKSHKDRFDKAARASGVDKASLIFWTEAAQTPDVPLVEARGKRPLPPEEMTAKNRKPDLWRPAPDVWEWMCQTFLVSSGPLYNPNHWHLRMAYVGVLWTNVEKRVAGQWAVGEASLPQVKGGRWVQSRADWQYRQWFGQEPDYLITLDSVWAARASDREFCRVCDHELLHCAIKYNRDGEPMITDDGKPMACMKGHDVEEFVSMADLYGVQSCAGQSVPFVEAANRRPKWTDADIEAACGPVNASTHEENPDE